MHFICFWVSICYFVVTSSASRANSEFSAKFELGYIKANKYKDYTPGNKEEIDGTQSKNSLTYSAEMIYNINNNIRAGLSLGFCTHRFSKMFVTSNPTGNYESSAKVEVKTMVTMLNGYYYFGEVNRLRPYLTLGVGLAKNKSRDYVIAVPEYDNYVSRSPGSKRISFAWQGGVGVQVPLSKVFSLDFSVKYFDYGITATKDFVYISQAGYGTEKWQVGAVGTKLRGGMATIGIIIDF